MKMFARYVRDFNGHEVQWFLIHYVDLIAYAITAYVLCMVHGGRFLQRLFGNSVYPNNTHPSKPHRNGRETLLDTVILTWNALMMFVSLLTVCALSSIWGDSVRRLGFGKTIGAWHGVSLAGGPMSFWLAVYTISKVAAFMDGVWVVCRNYVRGAYDVKDEESHSSTKDEMVESNARWDCLPFFEWYYQSLIAAYGWHTYTVGVSFLLSHGLCNAVAQSMVYVCRTLQSMGVLFANTKQTWGEENGTLKAVEYTMRGMECVIGTALILYGGYQTCERTDGCVLVRANARICTVMYMSSLGFLLADVWQSKRSEVLVNKGKKMN